MCKMKKTYIMEQKGPQQEVIEILFVKNKKFLFENGLESLEMPNQNDSRKIISALCKWDSLQNKEGDKKISNRRQLNIMAGLCIYRDQDTEFKVG